MIQEKTRVLTTQEVADRFNELAQQEKWRDIQNEFFAENVRSIEPPNSPYFPNAEGFAAVSNKAVDFVSRIQQVHSLHTSEPIVAGNHFAVVRVKDLTVEPHGRVLINQIMLYEVKDGQIVLEQFFY
ncbi:MAG: hypothetical protein C5B52_18825 [Bacteroidetes bacterium]|nr:MAG: hypothetical protein C5B52_18825 [Bacteroidota bacterium]